MFAVPWLVGWALKPYLKVNERDSVKNPASRAALIPAIPENEPGSLAAARAQVNQFSSPSAARRTPPVKSYSTTATTTPKPSALTFSSSSSSTTPSTSPLSSPLRAQTKPPYPVLSSTGGKQVEPPPVEEIFGRNKATVSRTFGTAFGKIIPIVSTPVSPVEAQGSPSRRSKPEEDSSGKLLVSSKTITLNQTMSADWAQQLLEKFTISFDEADKDKSGFLSFEEVINVLTKNGYKGSTEEGKKLFALLDVDSDKKLSRDEFTLAMRKLPRLTIKEFVLRKAFKQLDKDSSGTLTRAEIAAAVKQDGSLDIPAQRIADLLVILSGDIKDDVVNYEEFLQAFAIHEAADTMLTIFKALDTDKSGSLTRDEIMRAVDKENELKLRAAKISDVLLAWHKDADQKINYDEFVHVWTAYK